MKKLVTGLTLSLGCAARALAGSQIGGFSTFQISWSSGVVASAVPSLGTYGMLLLAALLALVVFRFSRSRGALVRAVAPLVTFGLAASFAFMTERPVAGGGVGPVDATSCNGSSTYTANLTNPPPCFVNTCGAPVTVSYTFIDGEQADTTPITDATCTRDYFCSGEGSSAIDGAIIPSDGLSYATAYCQEIFDGPEETDT